MISSRPAASMTAPGFLLCAGNSPLFRRFTNCAASACESLAALTSETAEEWGRGLIGAHRINPGESCGGIFRKRKKQTPQRAGRRRGCHQAEQKRNTK